MTGPTENKLNTASSGPTGSACYAISYPVTRKICEILELDHATATELDILEKIILLADSNKSKPKPPGVPLIRDTVDPGRTDPTRAWDYLDRPQ